MGSTRFFIPLIIAVLLNTVSINGDESEEQKSAAPVVTVSPDKITLHQNNDVLLYCNYYNTNSSKPIEVTWVHGVKDLDISGDGKSSHYKVDQAAQDGLYYGVENTVSQYLLIRNISPSDAGEYKCRVKSDEVVIVSQNTAHLTVLEPEVKEQTE